MIFRIGIENNNDDRSIAWALEHPGCFAYGRNSLEAQGNFPRAALDYAAWIAAHGESWLEGDRVEVRVEETFDAYFINNAFEQVEARQGASMVESFYRLDWKPLDAADIQCALKLLAWSRADLLSTVRGLSEEKLNRTYADERWSINGILRHIGGAEWWYQERIGYPYPENEKDLADDPFERLEFTRVYLNDLLPTLVGMSKVIGLDGEFWSPRKMLRRTLWHERDHTEHIRKLL
jgi:hypothetical protein